jgi:hypothetical protein
VIGDGAPSRVPRPMLERPRSGPLDCCGLLPHACRGCTSACWARRERAQRRRRSRHRQRQTGPSRAAPTASSSGADPRPRRTFRAGSSRSLLAVTPRKRRHSGCDTPPANDIRTIYTTDQLDRVKDVTDPAGGDASRGYDATGNVGSFAGGTDTAVSREWLYTQPALRAEIERPRDRESVRLDGLRRASAPARRHCTSAVSRCGAENQPLCEENQSLKDELAVAYGQQRAARTG